MNNMEYKNMDKILKIIMRKVFLIGSLVLIYYRIQMIFIPLLLPLKRPDLFWEITTFTHFLVYCAIAAIYGVLFPRSLAVYIALILQTVMAVYSFSSYHPLRSIEMNAAAYGCLIMPYIIEKYRRLKASVPLGGF